MKKLLIIDAHALIHRAFHALPPLTTKDNQPVNAVYGFLLILFSALKDIKPQYVAITFDAKGKTFRHKRYKEYKANREAPAEELVSQFPKVREVSAALGFPCYEVKGYEADDLIGTICKQFDGKGKVESIVLTGDLDLLQLVDKDTKVMRVRKGVKDTVLYDAALVQEQHGYTPEQVVEYKGLRGDSSDNIPGVKGVGEKTATTLLAEYGSIEEIYNNLENITGRARKALEGNQDMAELSKELATIATDAPITFKLEDAAVGSYKHAELQKLFRDYEFKSLLGQLKDLPGYVPQDGLFADPNTIEDTTPKGDEEYILVQEPEDIEELANKLKKLDAFAFDTETTGLNPLRDDLVGISFSWKDDTGYYLACGTEVPDAIKDIFENETIEKTAHNAKFDIKVLHRAGVNVQGVTFDSMLASYIVNQGKRGNGLDNLAFVEFGHEMQPISELIGTGRKQISMADVAVEKVSWYAAEDADYTWRLYNLFEERIEQEGQSELFYGMELPTMHALVGMEERGVRLDIDFLKKMSTDLHKRLGTIERKIHELAGGQFNVASSVQLKEVLYEKMGLSTEGIKKTKTGYSTAASELEKLRDQHEIIPLIEEHRELSKLTSTYIDALPKLVNPETGRIHTDFNQTIAATGRLSSTYPNLQNIPIRTELGREIRRAFAAEKGKKLLTLDYSQIELRVVAHLSKDPVMIEAFQNREDIHTRTAAELNDVDQSEVTKDMRRQAKAINFGILYGMGAFGIMRDSGVSREEAQHFLDKYFTIHKGIHAYIEQVKADTRQHGYAETLFGRKRALPDINASNRQIASAAERAAVNMPVQGTAADIMKLAMVAVDRSINAGDIQADMLLQVHDELVFEVDADRVEEEAEKIRAIMEGIYELDIPLLVDAEYGDNWKELTLIERKDNA